MSKHPRFKYWLMLFVPLAIAVVAVAWSGSRNHYQQVYAGQEDTTPVRKNARAYRDRDLEKRGPDKELDDLDRRMEFDFDRMGMEIEKSMKKWEEEMDRHQPDMEKIQDHIRDALKNIDLEQIEKETQRSVQQAMKNIDFTKMNADIEKSMSEVREKINSEDFRKELDAASKLDMDDLRRELDHVRVEVEKNRPLIREQLKRAQEDFRKAKGTLLAYQEMLDDMEADGLINQDGDYSIAYKNGELFVNEQKQPAQTRDKYKEYFKGDMKIYRKNGRFNINID